MSSLEGKPPTILLVEDDDDIRQALAEVLEGEGYRIVQCPNAAGAVAWFTDLTKSCDLMICDFLMPGDSIALTKYVRARGIPVLMMSAADKTLKQKLQLSGMADIPVIAKPMELHGLIAEVTRLLPLFSNADVEVWVA